MFFVQLIYLIVRDQSQKQVTFLIEMIANSSKLLGKEISLSKFHFGGVN